ncbi:clavesin-1 [Asbolus verrucosus]|uniref:Clavesin-1 n=1 Tax=Asbolus verrucosus TaxID=1661398 RepID=A0A482VER2_ASBVE|nr:clavesin-1 [Asbolus verrucosus]
MSPTLFEVDVNARQRALQLFGRTEEAANEDADTIKQWIKTQPHLPEAMEDPKIRNFLILNKHSVEKTKQKIDMYYTIRSLLPDMYEDSNPSSPKMRLFMDATCCCVHPKAVDGIYRVYFLKPKKPNKLAPRELGMQCGNISEVRLYEDCMVGDIIVFDMTNVTAADLTKVTPSLLVKLISIYEKIYSLRVKVAYAINSPSFVVTLTGLLKSILKPKIFSRVKVCQGSEVLREIFTEDELPRDYGGEGPSLEELNEMMKAKLDQYRNRFDQLDVLRVDERLRPQKLDNDDVLGFYGNFKKLNVD